MNVKFGCSSCKGQTLPAAMNNQAAKDLKKNNIQFKGALNQDMFVKSSK
ncbi:MAG: hypothetical protein MZV64_26810 [Ignavibacteriales bacterium]|nr:hypothetical protein [Ignavibacteriales bacterium]